MAQTKDKLVTELTRLARQMLALCESESSAEVLTISEEDAKERDRRLKRHQCLQCDVIESETEIFRRGLHEACYQASRRKIKSGEATWKRLEAAGLAMPPTAGGRPSSSGTRLDAFLESLESTEDEDDAVIREYEKSRPERSMRKPEPGSKAALAYERREAKRAGSPITPKIEEVTEELAHGAKVVIPGKKKRQK